MNKEQQIEKDRLIQIEEIDELIREKFHGQVAYRMDIGKYGGFNGYTPLCTYDISKALYNAGYRKVGSDAKGNLLKIQNLCIEFDEMGYEPTTLCENPEQTAKKWKSDLMYEIGLFLDESMGIKARYNELKAENERLTERLKQVLLSIDTVKEMNAMCNIDEQRKQAVKEFAEKLQKELPCRDYISNGNIYSMILTSSVKYVIDKLLKEYENE